MWPPRRVGGRTCWKAMRRQRQQQQQQQHRHHRREITDRTKACAPDLALKPQLVVVHPPQVPHRPGGSCRSRKAATKFAIAVCLSCAWNKKYDACSRSPQLWCYASPSGHEASATTIVMAGIHQRAKLMHCIGNPDRPFTYLEKLFVYRSQER